MIRYLLKSSVSLTVIFFLTLTPFPCHAIPEQLTQEMTTGNVQTSSLLRVNVSDQIQNLGLPVYAHQRDADAKDYVLVVAPQKQLQSMGLSYTVIDATAVPGSYLLALERRSGARALAAQKFTILHDDGRQIILRNDPGILGELAGMGFDLRQLPSKPIVLQAAKTSEPLGQTAATLFTPAISAMIDEVLQESAYDLTGNLAGNNPVTIGGSPYTITTRNTNSGVPIQKVTQYAFEYLEAQGLAVSYQNWSLYGVAGRNVIGTKTGKSKPGEIVLITAHIDNMPGSGVAPGADDNASGSAAVLISARIMASREFERTVRFVLFSGEEQGLLGSSFYASQAAAAGENIVAVYNMDMISWDSKNGPTLRLHTRTVNNPGYTADLALANQFVDVVNTYGFSSLLTPIITPSGDPYSDHASFWDNGFSSILAIEDDSDDFTPYYHTVGDTLASINKIYFTNYLKASVGTAAHLAQILVGACGSDNGKTLSTPAPTNLCDKGTASAVSGDGHPWSWTCQGSVGTNPAHCNATIQTFSLTVTVPEVNGTGDVQADLPSNDEPPLVIFCPKGVCTAQFNYGTLVKLTATPEPISLFTSWAGACSSDPCIAEMKAPMSVTANFTRDYSFKNVRSGEQDNSLDKLMLSVNPEDEIRMLATELTINSLVLDKGVKLTGGWKALHLEQTENRTVLKGSITVRDAHSVIKQTTVQGSLLVQSGRLLVDGVKIKPL